jgi:uncharacterized membrane protein
LRAGARCSSAFVKVKEIIVEREYSGNRKLAAWLGGAALGAVAMYLADPSQGRRRRALARDQLYSFVHRANETAGLAWRDAGNRWSGMRAEAGRFLQRNQVKPIDDHVLEARVRTRLGRQVSHPHSIHVTAYRGRVELRGAVLADEHAAVTGLVQAIPGVTEVKDRLVVHQDAERVAELQGEGRHARASSSAWLRSPAARTVAAAACGYYALTRRSPLGLLAALAGAGLLARGDRQAARHGQAVQVEKTIDLQATPEAVFDIWSRYESFPQFMSNVIEVRDLGDQRSHWMVKGPAGTSLEWDSVMTESIRPSVLSWRSEPGAAVEHEGTVRIEAQGDGTRVTVRMVYRPPAGALGQGVAALLGRDPRSELEQDLQRMKQFIESGVPPRDAAASDRDRGQMLH